jgi:hypothetical protein
MASGEKPEMIALSVDNTTTVDKIKATIQEREGSI